MIHNNPEIILTETLQLLQEILTDNQFDKFYLVGGTALALQIGHRHSVDLDFFTESPFETTQLESYLVNSFGFATDYLAKNTLKGYIRNTKVDFLTHAYPLVKPLVIDHNLKLASLQDIGAMKLHAISHSGNRQKDFYDVYFLLENLSLKQLLEAYEIKYASSNPIIPVKGITWFEDIDFEIEKPLLISEVTFSKVKKRLIDATQHPDRIFSAT